MSTKKIVKDNTMQNKKSSSKKNLKKADDKIKSKPKKIEATKKAILKRLSEAKNITITGHRNPDSDCICSGLALSLLLKKVFKKKSTVVNTDKMQKELKNIILVDNVIFEVTEETLPKKDVLVILDSGDIDRIGFISEITDQYNEVIFIDHHKVRNINGVTMFYDDMTAGATCEIIFDIFSSYLDKMDSNIATLLYTGMATDTGSFIFSNTTERTLLFASKLMSRKVSKEDVGNVVRKRYTKADIEGLTEIYNRMIIDSDKKIGYLCLEETICGHNLKDLAVSSSDMLIQMDDVYIGFIVHEYEDSFRVSIRSRCSKDIREIAESFGGGGHPKASGLSVSKNDYTKERLVEELKTKIINLLDS